jgi:hypothetical protein
MRSAPNIALKLLPGTSPEQARQARARAWALIFDYCHAKKEDAHPGVPDGAMKGSNSNDRATTIIPESS